MGVVLGIKVALIVTAIDGTADDMHVGFMFALCLSVAGFRRILLVLGLLMSSRVVELTKAIRLPSGDQTGFEAPLGRSVIAEASPPESDSIASRPGLALPDSSLSPPR